MNTNRLDLTSKLYQETLWATVLEVSEGTRQNAPLVVDFDPTTFCDLACPECISAKVLNQGRFSKERLASLADELVDSGVRAAILIGGGEPLAHPGTKEVIQRLGAGGIKIGLVTNGTLLDRYADELSEYASWVRVSVDAATTETFARVRPDKRGKSKFDKVISNMRSFALTKKGALGYSFLVITRFDEAGVLIESNHHEIFAAAQLAKEIGCDYFELKMMFDETHRIVPIANDVIAEIEGSVESSRSLEDENFVIEYSSTYESIVRWQSTDQPKDYQKCPVTELRTLITPMGVYVCPYHRGNPKGMIGDVVDMPFPVMWAQANTAVINPQEDCKFHCARHTTNIAIQGAKEETPVLIPEYDVFI